MGRFRIELDMREPEYMALGALSPGFGDTVPEVVQFIITDWLNKNLGLDWMMSHALVRGHLLKQMEKPKDGQKK